MMVDLLSQQYQTGAASSIPSGRGRPATLEQGRPCCYTYLVALNTVAGRLSKFTLMHPNRNGPFERRTKQVYSSTTSLTLSAAMLWTEGSVRCWPLRLNSCKAIVWLLFNTFHTRGVRQRFIRPFKKISSPRHKPLWEFPTHSTCAPFPRNGHEAYMTGSCGLEQWYIAQSFHHLTAADERRVCRPVRGCCRTGVISIASYPLSHLQLDKGRI